MGLQIKIKNPGVSGGHVQGANWPPFFNTIGFLELDGGPRSRANWPLEQGGGLINNQRARWETMGPLELAVVSEEEPICRVIFSFVKLNPSKKKTVTQI